MAKYYVYLLKSEKDSNFYIGQTDDINKRLTAHNSDEVKSTKYRLPLSLVGYEKYPSRNQAR